MLDILKKNIEYFLEQLPDLQDLTKGKEAYSLSDIRALADLFNVPFNYCFKYDLRKEDILIKDFSNRIKVLALDVDGVLTDAGMYIASNENEIKKFNAQDGIAIQYAINKGIIVILLSSGLRDEIISYRARMLKIPLFYVGRESKWDKLNNFCNDNNVTPEDVAYIGDDINDLFVLENVGLSICPQNAVAKVHKAVKIHLFKNGGEGAVRELVERLYQDLFD
ncbi:MAG: HAD hydrolase family protein [Bacteroidales bacterium]|jgi:3-deoxy-D-manno-octulosonate 8-phosphate phosphatase (KDO 8-P phosphatase)|nr:HAD hydrolase family protein [Bacteroidales bacterium]MDI9576172.1 HAD hydrolase family protein [Bacteroidota bacterium]MDD3755538.1 HAD hydrolase family protein [Bacteroidales bacterium]MDY0400675.1 HAD hydrolase family protein [Bacteroidales bacterium]HOB77423.1 HAD hydrolase family protein [Bacteroidales bacterium]